MADTGVDLKKLKVPELRKLLQDKGLDSKGNKAELVQRLQSSLDQNGDAGISILDEGSTEEDDEVLEDDDVVEVEDDDDDIEDDEIEEIVKKEEVVIAAEPKKTENTEIVSTETKEKPKLIRLSIDAPPKSPTSPTIKPVISPTLKTTTEQERIAIRAQRFGAQSEDARKAARAARFGTTSPVSKSTTTTTSAIKSGSTIVSGADLDKIKKRAERFGVNVSKTAVKLNEVEQKRKRQERFGAVLSSSSKLSSGVIAGDIEAKKQKRAERFGTNS
ncbi:uncharacterized protein LOC100369155 [Saccoglossus kowalevskii]|uniref:SAP domain-containing ribonucleoprotein-like n=1 Tax=Saccoglossus kowalevskii TaxID=10224 RepID=A0ABM0H0N6_SACKO|nr:PREDICTED: SAP domain-containing ribonucleoprotein-like [Saccoglossus kowalevskii]